AHLPRQIHPQPRESCELVVSAGSMRPTRTILGQLAEPARHEGPLQGPPPPQPSEERKRSTSSDAGTSVRSLLRRSQSSTTPSAAPRPTITTVGTPSSS